MDSPRPEPCHLANGGEQIELAAGDSSLTARGHPRFASKPPTRSGDTFRMTANWGVPISPPAEDLVFDADAWRLYRTDAQWHYAFHSPVLGGEEPYKCATVDPDYREAAVTVWRDPFVEREHVDPFEYPLDELLVIHRLLNRGSGIELHACAVRDQSDIGYLFVGPSGAGKTTTAQLWAGERGCSILSDDRVIVRTDDDRPQLYGTPWHGEGQFASGGSVPLQRIFFIEHADANRTAPVDVVQATMRLFAATFAAFHDAQLAQQALSLCEQLARAVPCAELGFVPDRPAVGFVRQVAAELPGGACSR